MGPGGVWWTFHLRGSGLTPGQSTKTLSATWLRYMGEKERESEMEREREGRRVGAGKKVIKIEKNS